MPIPHEHIEFIFIDESGDLGRGGSTYFVIVALGTHERERLGRIMKRLRERKLKKKLKETPELKGNNSNDEIRRFVLGRLALLPCTISAVAIPKSKVKDYLFEHKNKLYNYLCGLLMEQISLKADIIDITIDKKDNNRLLQEDFNQYIRTRILGRRPEVRIKIQHLDSHSSNELQVADFVVWAINRHFSGKDSEFYDLIKSKITNAGFEEIWKEG